LYDVQLPHGKRPAVVLTRDTAIPLLNHVCLAPITSTVRGLVTEVPVGPANGLRKESVVNCDNITTASKAVLGKRRGSLNPEQSFHLNIALKIALGLDD
jgi:mRNA interferase MazF